MTDDPGDYGGDFGVNAGAAGGWGGGMDAPGGDSGGWISGGPALPPDLLALEGGGARLGAGSQAAIQSVEGGGILGSLGRGFEGMFGVQRGLTQTPDMQFEMTRSWNPGMMIGGLLGTALAGVLFPPAAIGTIPSMVARGVAGRLGQRAGGSLMGGLSFGNQPTVSSGVAPTPEQAEQTAMLGGTMSGGAPSNLADTAFRGWEGDGPGSQLLLRPMVS